MTFSKPAPRSLALSPPKPGSEEGLHDSNRLETWCTPWPWDSLEWMRFRCSGR